MTDKYIPQVGDRARLLRWRPSDFIDVEAVTDRTIYGVSQSAWPSGWPLDHNWIKVDKPRLLPECWLTVDQDDDDMIKVYGRANLASRRPYPHDTYRIWSDPDGTPRIERVDGEATA